MTSAAQPEGPPPGLTVGGYELLSRLGEGGMGVVHLARKPGGERVALKVLRPHVVGDDEARRRLAREVSSLSRVRSRRVAEIVDADPWGDVPFVATRYVPGLSLHDHVHEEGPVTGDDLVWFASCLAEALSAVHAVGVLHRDVKPGNVLMEGRTPILIDFGLARVADDAQVTQTGWLLGTPGYLAPEILHGEDATGASDVHSWASTVAFAATGRAPFGRGPSMAVMDRVRRGEHDLEGVDPRLEPVLAECLDPRQGDRPPLPELRHWLESLAPSRRRSRVPESLPDLLTAPLAVAGAGAVTPDTEQPDTDPTDDVAADAPTDVAAAEDHDLYRDLFAQDRPITPAPPETLVQPVQEHPDPAGDRSFLDDWEDDGWTEQPTHKVGALERVRRGALSVAGVALGGAGIAAAPYVTAVVLVVLAWLLASCFRAATAAGLRRKTRGRTWYDAPLVLVSAPWHLLAAVPGVLLLAVWSLGLAAVVALICYAAGAPELLGLGLVGAGFALGMWWGPGSFRVRGPVNRVAHPVAARGVPWLLVTVLLLAGAGVLAYLATSGIEWFPADGHPLEGVDLPEVPRWLRP